jgi:thiol-disulfide isomerase/thioredoxin
MNILSNFETPSTQPLLKKMAAHPNEQIAMQAKSILQQRQFMLDLKKKPLDLKFTAIDGTQIDAAKLRGKVVLIDFWASWCGPCMADAPAVVAAYNKLRERGFEIIGVSLDNDKAAMEAAIKSAGMNWPQAFDGKGWQAEIAQRFGVRAIPSTWLFDKKGKLREHGLRGAELESRIENLLREK